MKNSLPTFFKPLPSLKLFCFIVFSHSLLYASLPESENIESQKQRYLYFEGGQYAGTSAEQLYRRLIDGSGEAELLDNHCGSTPVIAGNYIYYQGKKDIITGSGWLVRRPIDSSGPLEKIDDYCGSSPVVAGKYIYYQGGKTTFTGPAKLYRRLIDGSGEAQKLDDYCGSSPAVSGSYVYYKGGQNLIGDAGQLYRRLVDGSGEAQKLDDYCGGKPVISGDYVYYMGGSNNHTQRDQLWRCKVDGTNKQKLDSYCGSPPAVEGKYVYFQGGTRKNELWCRRTNGSGDPIKLDDNCSDTPVIYGAYVYFKNGMALWRTTKDLGSGATKIDDYCGSTPFIPGLKGGVLIIGSLLWQNSSTAHPDDNVRKNWRDNHLLPTDIIQIKAPIRYGRYSNAKFKGEDNELYTMILSAKYNIDNKQGQAPLYTLTSPIKDIKDLRQEVKALAKAEGISGKYFRKTWGSVSIWISKQFFPMKNDIETSWKIWLHKFGPKKETAEQYLQKFKGWKDPSDDKEDISILKENGTLNIDLFKSLSESDQQKLDTFDFILCAVTVPRHKPREEVAIKSYPTPQEIGQFINTDKRKYFEKNRRHNIITSEDSLIIKSQEILIPPPTTS